MLQLYVLVCLFQQLVEYTDCLIVCIRISSCPALRDEVFFSFMNGLLMFGHSNTQMLWISILQQTRHLCITQEFVCWTNCGRSKTSVVIDVTSKYEKLHEGKAAALCTGAWIGEDSVALIERVFHDSDAHRAKNIDCCSWRTRSWFESCEWCCGILNKTVNTRERNRI